MSAAAEYYLLLPQAMLNLLAAIAIVVVAPSKAEFTCCHHQSYPNCLG